MQVMFEWRTGDPPPDGLISLAVRLTDAEARALIDAPEPTDPVGQAVWQALRVAENTGELLIPS